MKRILVILFSVVVLIRPVFADQVFFDVETDTKRVILEAGQTNDTDLYSTKADKSGTDDITTTGTVEASKINVIENAEPATPPFGRGVIYTKPTKKLYFKNDLGNETEITGGEGDLKADGTVPLTADWDVGAYIITGLRFISDVATGTAPFTVSSTTAVTNLNSDLLDGEHAAAFQDADSNLDTLSTPTTWRLFYSNGSSVLTELVLGADGTYLKSNGASLAPTFDTPAGSGDVVGPASAVDGNIATFDGVTGKLIKDSGATLDSNGLSLTASSTPAITLVDADSGDADQGITQITANATTTTAGAVVSDMTFTYKDGTDASGVYTDAFAIDGSENAVVFSIPTTLQAGDISAAELAADAKEDAIEFVIDGGGSAITTGTKGYLEIPWGCTINSVTMLADQSGSAVVDIWVDTYANYPPADADSITASAVPTISTAVKSQDVTLTGWTTSLSKGSVIGFNVDSASTIERLTISLKVDK